MRRIGVVLLLGLASGLAGCGYSAGGPYRQGISTVHVGIFGTREFRRGLEFQLTEAVKKRIALDTPYRLSVLDHADTTLTGDVLEVRQAAWAPDPLTRQPREEQMTLAVQVRWKDLRTGKMLIDAPIRLQAADYLPASGETEAYTEQRVIEKMAQQIVAQMYDQW